MTPSIDRAALNDLLEATGNDRAFLVELIDTYLTDSVALLASMRQAVGAADATALRRAAHSLKSNSASLGARELSARCQELEQDAKNGSLEGAEARLVSIAAVFADVERELHALQDEFK